jgi:hypothetical protein
MVLMSGVARTEVNARGLNQGEGRIKSSLILGGESEVVSAKSYSGTPDVDDVDKERPARSMPRGPLM